MSLGVFFHQKLGVMLRNLYIASTNSWYYTNDWIDFQKTHTLAALLYWIGAMINWLHLLSYPISGIEIYPIGATLNRSPRVWQTPYTAF